MTKWIDYSDNVLSMQIPDNLQCAKNKTRLFRSLRGRAKSSTIQDLAIDVHDVANTGMWNGTINYLKSLRGEKKLSPRVEAKELLGGPIKTLDSGYGSLGVTITFSPERTTEVSAYTYYVSFKLIDKIIYLASGKTVHGESDFDVKAMADITIRICHSISLRT